VCVCVCVRERERETGCVTQNDLAAPQVTDMAALHASFLAFVIHSRLTFQTVQIWNLNFESVSCTALLDICVCSAIKPESSTIRSSHESIRLKGVENLQSKRMCVFRTRISGKKMKNIVERVPRSVFQYWTSDSLLNAGTLTVKKVNTRLRRHSGVAGVFPQPIRNPALGESGCLTPCWQPQFRVCKYSSWWSDDVSLHCTYSCPRCSHHHILLSSLLTYFPSSFSHRLCLKLFYSSFVSVVFVKREY